MFIIFEMHYNFDNSMAFMVICIGFALRGVISLSSYSGASTPPLFGDYEAQRHWQEITFNLPATKWYSNTSNNDLLYWGLDYPPLTAYHSFALGVIANRMNSSYVSLSLSRGIESEKHKSFMRLTVLAADLLLYIPAATLAIFALNPVASKYMLYSLMLIMFYPCQILIDNGHFQYNNISLGLFLSSVTLLVNNRCNWASFAFSLAVNYKQMELYHALPIFVYLLKASFSKKTILKNIFSLTEVGFITMVTFCLLWMPWTSSTGSLTTAALRLFPLNRGVFEDKVANIWCSLNAFYKLKENIQNDEMVLICLATTLAAIIPTNLHLLCTSKRNTTLLYALVNTSLSFFLLSFQVHEKSILLAAVPTSLLFKIMPFSILCFLKISTFSTLPLLIRDHLHITYFCMTILYLVIFKYLMRLVYTKDDNRNRYLNVSMNLLDIIILIISFTTLFLPCPERLPYLWSFIISFFSCIVFIIFLIKCNVLQYYNCLTSF